MKAKRKALLWSRALVTKLMFGEAKCLLMSSSYTEEASDKQVKEQ